jgi:hypothetical protein
MKKLYRFLSRASLVVGATVLVGTALAVDCPRDTCAPSCVNAIFDCDTKFCPYGSGCFGCTCVEVTTCKCTK